MKLEFENVDLVRKIAWSFHKTTGLNFDDLMHEAVGVYCEAIHNYKPNQGQKFTTFAWMLIQNALVNYAKKQQKINTHSSEFELETLECAYCDESAFYTSNFFESLSKEAQEIVDLVLTFPDIFVKDHPKMTKQHIKKMLQNRGWEKEKIRYAFNNIKNAL